MKVHIAHWFIIIKDCFIGRFLLKIENYFWKLNHVLIKGALEKICEVFACCGGYTDRIELYD